MNSYALPPQTYLCCPPCSINLSPQATAGGRRKTFVVTKDGEKSLKRRILSYSEIRRSKSSDGNSDRGPERRECKLRNGDIFGLEALPSAREQQPSLLVSHSNGDVELVHGDLTTTRWQSRPKPNQDELYVVEHISILDTESARTGILRDRQDALALLKQTATAERGGSLLCRIVRTGTGRQVELYTIVDTAQSNLQTTQSILRSLVTYQLPSTSHSQSRLAHYELNPTSGRLSQLLDGKLTVYDLTGTVPKVVTRIVEDVEAIEGFVSMSDFSLLTLTRGTATLRETSFGSIKASISLASAIASSRRGKKRKRDDSTVAEMPLAVAAFGDVGVVVCLAGCELVALQIGQGPPNEKVRKSGGSLLSDVLGRGHADHGNGATNKGWTQWKADVDELITLRVIENLEKLVFSIGSGGNRRKRESLKHGQRAESTDGMSKVSMDKALYILSKTFSYRDEGGQRLEIRIASSKILEWLAAAGVLSAWHIERALLNTASVASRVPLTSGDVMAAIQRIDTDFQLMRNLLVLPVHWDVAEIVQALRFVTQSFDTPAADKRLLALPAPPSVNGGPDMEHGELNGDHEEIESESRAAENEIALVMNALDTGLELRSDTLRIILLRLHTFSAGSITAAMREFMTHGELIFFVHMLRIELADGGWTSKYIDVGDEDIRDGLVNTRTGELERDGPNDQAVQAIGDLLNCAVDAIGIGGWLVGQSSASLRTDELIDSLRAEVSAGLEGCYEATTLSALLMELKRSAAAHESARNRRTREADHLESPEHAMLPLSPSADLHSALHKGGKRQRKSKMAIGEEKSRQVGKYSFDRIRI